jgi:hypothetical protein
MAGTLTPLRPDSDEDDRYKPESLKIHPEHAEAEIDELEKILALDSPEDTPPREKLDTGEPEGHGPSARDDMRDALGMNGKAEKPETPATDPGFRYSGKHQKDSRAQLSGLLNNNDKNDWSKAAKKKLAIAGALAGGSAVGGTLLFLALLPLKIEHIVKNLETKYTAQATDAIGNETGNALSRYVAKQVLPSMNRGTCKTTISPDCVVTGDNGSSPMSKLWTAWRQGRLEYTLATKYDIVIGRDGTGPNSFIMTVQGQAVGNHEQFRRLQAGEISLGDFNTTGRLTRTELRAAINEAVEGSTLWKKTYIRFKVGKLLETKFGVRRCIFFCKAQDRLADWTGDKVLAVKGTILDRFVPDKYALILSCVITGATGNCDPTHLANATAGDTERLNPFERQLQERLVAYAAGFGDNSEQALRRISNLSRDISRDGIGKVLAREATGKVFGVAAGDAAGEAVEKAVPVLGWVNMIAQVINGAAKIGPLLRYGAYLGAVSSAVATYELYNSYASETQSGHGNTEESQAMNRALETNLSGSSKNSVDFSQSKLFAQEFGGASTTSSASIFSAFLPGTAFAAGAVPVVPSNYLCDDGKPIPANLVVCPEENFADDGNHAADIVSNTTNAVPGIVPAAGLVAKITGAPSDWASSAFEKLPGYDKLTTWIGDATAGPLGWVQKQVITTPDIDSGARQVDMMIAGADAVGNTTCQVQLGCARISDKVAADIRNRQMAEDRQEFDNRPLFARMFSTDTPYSLVSQLAMSIPTTPLGLSGSGLANLLSNPFSKLDNVFASLVSSRPAFAAAQVRPDPFGIIQYGYKDIPKQPDVYWDTHCASKYNSTTDKLDISEWLNSQHQDEKTGQAVADTENPCMLIQTTMQVNGMRYDTSLAPPGSANPDPQDL